jgi:PAS domain S-box-containing protein
MDYHERNGVTGHLYRNIVESMSEAAVVIRRSDGEIVYGNGRFAEMVRTPVDRIVGARLYDFLPEKERLRFESTFCGSAEGGRGEFTIACGEDTGVAAYVSGRKVDAGGCEGACLVITDITIRKRAEEVLRSSHEDLERRVEERTRDLSAANDRLKREVREREQAEIGLRESEEHFRLLIENALDIVMVLKGDGTITYASPSVKRVLGYGTKGFVNRNFLDFVRPEGKEGVWERFARAGKIPGHTMSLEAELKRKDGSWRIIEMISRNLLHDPKVAGIVVNGRDITERKQMEEKLLSMHRELEVRVEERTGELRSAYERLEVEIREHKEAEEERARLALAIEQGGDCVIITDSRGIIQYMNPASEKISLYNREEITGRPFDVLKGGDEAVWDEMWRALRAGQVWTGRTVNRKKGGSTYEVERTMSPIRENNGAVTNYVAVERDMTKQVGLEAELRQAQKMQAIGTLAGGIAHDFNNILAAIIGFTELALDDTEGNSKGTRHLEQVRKAGYRGRDLVKQILAFSRQGEQEKKAVQVAPIVREVVKLMRASLPSTVHIIPRIETDEGIVLADPVQIHQLLINLCTNAGQALKTTKGTLEVRLEDFAFSDPKEAPHPDLQPGRYVKLCVSDTGPGVDTLIKDRIFEPFFTSGDSGGRGLGLSVVYGIVKGHNGAMTVSSAQGVGSTFAVYLKKLKEAMMQQYVRPAAIPTPGKRRILFVDDEEALVEMGKQMLERMGYEVVAEMDSVKALKRFQRDPAGFDLVITDQTMPNMTGMELARKMMSIKKDIPIILCTGFSEAISSESAKALGIREFVMKPIIRNEMAETIKKVIAGAEDGTAGV